MNQGTFNRISDVLKNDNKIVIPDLQRDYCWGTVISKDNKKSLTYNFTSELIEEAKNQLKYKEFSYGIIYTYEYPETFLYLCDGQQRLTTLYLIMGVLNCYQNNPKLTEMLQLKNGQPRLKYEVRNSTDYFIKDLVNSTFKDQKTADLIDVSKTNWYRDLYKDDPSIMSIVTALIDINKLINTDNFEQLTTFLLDKVGFVYINLEAKEEGTKLTYSKIREYGEKMYDIVNTYGDSIEIIEHQKSVLLSKFPKEIQIEWSDKWQIWQDFFLVNKGSHNNADDELNEFLSWIVKKEEGTKQTYSKIREYGEKMYEIVNTCGDPMEVNEHQKSVLLSKIPKEKQRDWTTKWEIWQDFFWVHRGTQLSADEGFNEFLSWIAKIEERPDYTIEVVEHYFKAFFHLMNCQDKLSVHRNHKISNLKEDFIKNQKPDLMVLYPCMIYLKNTEAVHFEQNKYSVYENLIDYDYLFRYMRFFSNISKNSEAFELAIQLAKQNGVNKDVTNFIGFETEVFKNILSKEEVKKLTIFSNCSDEMDRKKHEDKIWTAEDHNYLNGKIKPLFKWIDIINSNNQNEFILSEFDNVYQFLIELTNKDNIEKLRITLLSCSKNFSDFREGWSWGVERFYLGLDNNFAFWRKWISSKEMEKIILLYSKNEPLEKIISEELNLEIDVQRKTIIKYLLNLGTKFWQWNISKRFFIYNNEICFPNGVQAKANTERKKIF
nr:DUF262 domain-containing protein [uncultured Flavobacterium sp.]